MIAITKYRELLDFLGANTKFGFEVIKLARTEDELAKIIKDVDDYMLIGIVPSSDTIAGGVDNIIENDTIVLYIIHKVSDRDRDDSQIEADITIAQQYVYDIKYMLQNLYDHFDHPLNSLVRKIDFNSMHTDPEYNYMGCDGYSISFVLTTDWF